MTAHPLTHEDHRRPAHHPAFSQGPFRLGWAEFWLLSLILAGLLSLAALLVLFYVAAR